MNTKTCILLVAVLLWSGCRLPVEARFSPPEIDQVVRPDKVDSSSSQQGKKPLHLTQNADRLTGSTLSLKEAVTESDMIFIGKVSEIGRAARKAAGRATYHGVQFTVTKVLKGKISSPALFELSVVAVPSELREAPPIIGRTYIVFGKIVNGWNLAIKLVPSSDATISDVKALSEVAPASK